MQSYKTIDLISASLGTILFTNHEFIPILPNPCFIGSSLTPRKVLNATVMQISQEIGTRSSYL
jgi:hypothetical protein